MKYIIHNSARTAVQCSQVDRKWQNSGLSALRENNTARNTPSACVPTPWWSPQHGDQVQPPVPAALPHLRHLTQVRLHQGGVRHRRHGEEGGGDARAEQPDCQGGGPARHRGRAGRAGKQPPGSAR